MWLVCREAAFALRSLLSEKTNFHGCQKSEGRKWNSPIHGIGTRVGWASWTDAQGTENEVTLRKEVCRSTRVHWRGSPCRAPRFHAQCPHLSQDQPYPGPVHCEPMKEQCLYTDPTSGEPFWDGDSWREAQTSQEAGKELSDGENEIWGPLSPTFLLLSPQNQSGDSEMKEPGSLDLAIFVSISDAVRKQS